MGNNYPGDAAGSWHIGPPTSILAAFGRFLVPFLTALVLLLVGALVFHNFLLGDKVLLYKDVGADSINDSYPYFVHLSDYVRREGFPSWSFYVGMGQSLFYLTGNLIWEPVIWLPRELIARAVVFQHLLKTLIAGLLFFRFLQLRGINLCAALTGALLLSFSAYMCVGGCWIISADEVVCFTFLLFAVEEAIVALLVRADAAGRDIWLEATALVRRFCSARGGRFPGCWSGRHYLPWKCVLHSE